MIFPVDRLVLVPDDVDLARSPLAGQLDVEEQREKIASRNAEGQGHGRTRDLHPEPPGALHNLLGPH
jgi:hypothetical protein